MMRDDNCDTSAIPFERRTSVHTTRKPSGWYKKDRKVKITMRRRYDSDEVHNSSKRQELERTGVSLRGLRP